jgi:3-oxoacyl-[acyl-carrier protein] reductase
VTVIADLAVDAAEKLASEVSAEAPSLAIHCDVTVPGDLDRAVKAATDLGELDILVCCAGWPGDAARLEAFPMELWQRVFDINTMGVVNALRAVTPGMRERRHGVIVSVASIAGIYGSRGQVAYSGAKAAVLGITRAAAKELMRDGIRVNAVAPGFIQTPMTAAMTEELRNAWRVDQLTVGGRLGLATEVAAAIDFLTSEDASYITGTTLTIDGGFTLGNP